MKRYALVVLCLLLAFGTLAMGQVITKGGEAVTMQASVTKAATFSGASLIKGLGNFKSLVVTLDVTSAERDTGNETYDFYITTGDGVSSWDIVHFPQIASTGAKRYTAIVSGDSRPVNTTTAGPGLEAVTTATLNTVAAGADQGIKTLTAGYVRHGPIGDRIGYELVVAGTVATGIVYSITVTPKP